VANSFLHQQWINEARILVRKIEEQIREQAWGSLEFQRENASCLKCEKLNIKGWNNMVKVRLNKDKMMSYNDFERTVYRLTGDRGSIIKFLEQQLQSYERKYKMSSDEFYALFEAGKLEDIHDFAVWAGKYYLYREATQRNK
jgi:hypothetical protein